MADAVRVDGLQPLRKALRNFDREALRDVQKVTRSAAQIVADEAGRLAPRGTRPIPPSRRPRLRLHQSYRATTSGSKGIVRSRLPHAPIVEYRRTGTPAQMRNVRPVGRAIENRRDDIELELQHGLNQAMSRHGLK